MTYPLSETFNDPRGRWDQFSPWDGTEASDSVKGFLATQQHVDLRCFRVVVNTLPVPQTDLEAVPQSTLDAEPQSQMETQPGQNTLDEQWSLTGTGLSSMTVGAMASRGGWPGLKATTTADAISATLTSSLTHGIDISAMTNLSIIFPDYNAFDSESYIQLTSDPNGAFGTGHDSAQVQFAANISVMPQVLVAISGFANAGFDNTKVTGVRVWLSKTIAPAGGLTVTMMAIRGLVNAWTESALDFDTRLGGIVVPPTLTGSLYGGTVAKNFQFVRGDGTKEDPIPADLTMNMFFYPGGSTSPNDATGGVFNEVGFIFREEKDTTGGTGSHIEAKLQFNDTQTKFEVRRVDTTGGSPGTPTVFGDTTFVVSGALNPAQIYLLTVQLRGTEIQASLYGSDIDDDQLNLIWVLPTTLTNALYPYRNGRVGFIANLVSRDAYVNEIDVAPTGYASLTTQPYESRTPVDGVRLAVVSASDLDLFTQFSGPDLFIDQTKTISGNGSFRTAQSLTTNTFIMDDWTQSYLDLAIWVPNIVTLLNQPIILLNTGTALEQLPLPRLQPAQWNKLHFDLGIFRNLLTAAAYSFTIQAAPSPDRALGYFWIDDFVIGRRRVAWSARATPNGPFRYFMDLVNKPNGAVHFGPDERGTQLQIRAEALTEDAWVSSFNAFPRYAQIGLPVYDMAFETH